LHASSTPLVIGISCLSILVIIVVLWLLECI